MGNEVLQDVENLWLDCDKVAAATQFASISIEAESVECVDQLVAPPIGFFNPKRKTKDSEGQIKAI